MGSYMRIYLNNIIIKFQLKWVNSSNQNFNKGSDKRMSLNYNNFLRKTNRQKKTAMHPTECMAVDMVRNHF
jgi:hypothetical protein